MLFVALVTDTSIGHVPIVTVPVLTGPYLCSGSCSCVVHTPGDRHIYRTRTYCDSLRAYLCSGSCSCAVHTPGDRHIYRTRTYCDSLRAYRTCSRTSHIHLYLKRNNFKIKFYKISQFHTRIIHYYILVMLQAEIRSSKAKKKSDVRNAKSGNITSSGENRRNIRTNASPKLERTRCPEE